MPHCMSVYSSRIILHISGELQVQLCIPGVRVAITLLPPILYHHAILLHDLYLYSR